MKGSAEVSSFPSSQSKILTHDALANAVETRQRAGQRVVFTNGVFDLIHVGHVRYLEEARALGDALIVAVNADSSVKQFKGDLRPILSEDDRAELIASLACVDYVTIFDTRTPVPLIEQVKPLIYVKGGDYKVEDLPEAVAVAAYGGEVRILSLVGGKSTTNIIAKICRAYPNGADMDSK